MTRWKDPFPQTPQGFHDRVEATLRGLEKEENMKHMRYPKLAAVIAAAVAALLAIGAVAAVIGNNTLKQELSDAGAADMAGRVQEVHLADAGDGFGFSVDEIVWEDQDLYVSYSLSVPEDGDTYLVGLMVPEINGERADYRYTCYLDDIMPIVMALGGDYPTAHTFVLPILADSRRLGKVDMKLGVKAAFFKTDRPLEYVENFYDDGGMYNSDKMIRWTGGIVSQNVFPNADTLYYHNVEDDGTPLVSLTYFPEVLRTMAAEDAEADGDIALIRDSEGYPWRALTPAGLDRTGIATLVAERGVELPLDGDMVSHDLYNGLEENTFRYEDMTVVVENFRMTHFSLAADIWIIPDGGMPADYSESTMDLFPGLFILVNSEKLPVGGFSSSIERMSDGVLACHEEYDGDGYIPLGNLESLALVARHWDEAAKDYADEIVVAELKPILDNSAIEAEEAAIALREAAGQWQPGDPDITVWATDKGTYYHLDPDCGGMMNPHEWHIADTVAAGKPACPVCAGGQRGPAEWEEGEDISDCGGD